MCQKKSEEIVLGFQANTRMERAVAMSQDAGGKICVKIQIVFANAIPVRMLSARVYVAPFKRASASNLKNHHMYAMCVQTEENASWIEFTTSHSKQMLFPDAAIPSHEASHRYKERI